MSDIFSKDKRSEIMSQIGQKNTKSEIIVRKILYNLGFRYRLHDRRIFGTPNIVLKSIIL